MALRFLGAPRRPWTGAAIMLTEAAQSLCNFWLRLAKVSHFVTDKEKHGLQRLTEVVKETLWDRVRRFLAEHRDAPLLQSYSNDGTPLQNSVTVTERLSKHHLVKRRGKDTTEFLLERCFFMVLGAPPVLLMREPRPMMNGVKAANCWAATRDFVPDVRAMGHRGLLTKHFAYDRKFVVPLERFALQEEEVQEQRSVREEGEQAMLSLCTFILVTACILHLAHNALKWAMFHNAPNAFKLERRFCTFG